MQSGVTVILVTVWLAGAAGILSTTFDPFQFSSDQYSPQLSLKHHQTTKGSQSRINWNIRNLSKDNLRLRTDETYKAQLFFKKPNWKLSIETPRQYGSQMTFYRAILPIVSSNFFSDDDINGGTELERHERIDEEEILDMADFDQPKELIITQRDRATSRRVDSDYNDRLEDRGLDSIEINELSFVEVNPLLDLELKEVTGDVMKTVNGIEEMGFDVKKDGIEVESGGGKDDTKEKYGFKEISKENRLRENETRSGILTPYDFQIGFKSRISRFNPQLIFSDKLLGDSVGGFLRVGGVPELQIGCEGMEASNRDKRLASMDREDKLKDGSLPTLQTGSIVQLGYESSEDVDDPQGVFYQERDELIKLKKLESELGEPSLQRGDIPIYLQEEYDKEEKLPIRGDLASVFLDRKFGDEKKSFDAKDKIQSSVTRHLVKAHQWNNRRRKKREIGSWDGVLWGFGEDEGILPDDELQLEDERREQEQKRIVEAIWRKEEEKKRGEAIRRRGEEEKRRRKYPKDWQEGERGNQRSNRSDPHGRNEGRNIQYKNREAEKGSYNGVQREQQGQKEMTNSEQDWPVRTRESEEGVLGTEENRVRQRQEEGRRRIEGERRRHSENGNREEQRRRERGMKREEELRRREEMRRRREEMEKRMQQDLHPPQKDRAQEEENERKLKDYIQRNTPIVIGAKRPADDTSVKEPPKNGRRYAGESAPRTRHSHHNKHQYHMRDEKPVWLEYKRAMESARPYNMSDFKILLLRGDNGSHTLEVNGESNQRREIEREYKGRNTKPERSREQVEGGTSGEEERRLEEEDRRKKSQMYEENRKWHERMIHQAEKMRQEWVHEASRRSQAERKPEWHRWYRPSGIDNLKGYQPQRGSNNDGYYQYLRPNPATNNKGYQPSRDFEGYQYLLSRDPDLKRIHYSPLAPNSDNNRYLTRNQESSKGGLRSSPVNSDRNNNKRYQPPPVLPDLNNKGYQPPPVVSNSYDKGYQPPPAIPDSNNKGYQPPPAVSDPNNKGYQPPLAVSNSYDKGYQLPPAVSNSYDKGYQPPPAIPDSNNKGYQPPPAVSDPNNKGYQPPSLVYNSYDKRYQPQAAVFNSNDKGYQPPPVFSNSYDKGYQPPLTVPNSYNEGYQSTPLMNNKRYQTPPPIPDLNNKGYQASTIVLDLNNKINQPPPMVPNSYKGYQSTPIMNNRRYQAIPTGNHEKGHAPSRIDYQLDRDQERLEQERRRIEIEWQTRNRERYQEQKRKQETIRTLEDQRKRLEEERLNTLPVSATIIIGSGGSGNNSLPVSVFLPRGSSASKIEPLANIPNRERIEEMHSSGFTTRKQPIQKLHSCAPAVIKCCSRKDRVDGCFESLGCPVNYLGPDPCDPGIIKAANNEFMKSLITAQHKKP